MSEFNLEPKVPFLQFKDLTMEESTKRNTIALTAAIHALYSLLTDEQKSDFGNIYPTKYSQVAKEVDK